MFIDASKNLAVNPQGQSQPQDQPQDRRYFHRWELKERVSYRKENEKDYQDVTTKDISVSGACINTQDDLMLGQRVDLKFYLSEDSHPIIAQGRVMWRSASIQDKFLGIEFQWIDSDAKDLIFDYAFKRKPEELYRCWFKGC